MKLSLFGRLAVALFASLVLGLGMTGCGGGTIAYLWVLGQQYNQVAGFKVDDYTGNLTAVTHSPFSSQGANPVSIAVKSGGRFVFVLNQGTGGSASGRGASSGVAVFSVGGDGSLTYQATYQSQGYVPQWLALDSTGSYLYVLDKYSPGYVASTNLYTGANTDGLGAITAFSIDGTTGRLSLVTNSTVLRNGLNTPFFEVGGSPFMMKSQGSCLLTVNSADNSISPYTFGTNGQLNFTGSTGNYIVSGAKTISSINGSGSYVYLTDSSANTIIPYSLGTSCTLTPVTGGSVANESGASDPVYTLLDSTSKYLYVLNHAQVTTGSSTQAYSYLSAYTVNTTNGQLTPISDAPYTVGSGPVCMVEDPTNQYMYVSNYNDGTVTGKLLDPTTGRLEALSRGSTFAATGQATCLGLSGSVD
ncbi:6-phosphogluconolactonase, cycloisomerase 2 family [Bryocella elongata]|uniref:6-phosphogluconolactonase, cycloisomerase 2 family n=1 Tax=Bryocella elongata TaxID=863522 RepID=A0A1H6BNA8_9BACT|nr:beta-propeller fold lactonase family protein [Bryocella elongata]SEG62164.1 6-phosphogluconolactonase, cycloisomerase 2 family [Bryocella elongata]